jgi:hypothetical protein
VSEGFEKVEHEETSEGVHEKYLALAQSLARQVDGLGLPGEPQSTGPYKRAGECTPWRAAADSVCAPGLKTTVSQTRPTEKPGPPGGCRAAR